MARHLPLETRIWAKVDKRGPDECWPWTGWAVGGYGKFKLRGKTLQATRLVWSVANGVPFPEGMLACHSCDNPICCNPAHIWAGTHLENMRDMHRKGRNSGSICFTYGETCSRGHRYDEQRPYPADTSRRCRTCHYESTYRASAIRRAAARDAL